MRSGDSESTSRRLRRSLLQIFEPQLMTSEDAVKTAVAVFEGHMGESRAESLLNAVLEVPWLLEFILSAISDEAFQSLQTSILDMYPVNLGDHILASLPFTLLARLFDPVCSLSLSSDRLRSLSLSSDRLRSCEPSVRFADRVLQQLNNLRHNLAADGNAETEPADEDLANWAAIGTIKRGSQRARKQARTLASRPKKSRTVLVDDKVFHQYGLPEFAKDSAILEDTARLVKVRHKSDLKYILSLLRSSSEDNVAAAIKKAYIRPTFTGGLSVESTSGSLHSPSDTDSSTLVNGEANDGADTPAAYPMVQPMKAALYFDSADGFGDWRILISTRADRNLREARNKDQTSFRIYIKKIKELSNGHFSDDNQKRLTSADIPVPIYEAKMTRDTRLVYQVDCVPEFDSDVERQVIRIFGIYTHAQLDKRFWNSMGYQLARKGREYKARCTFRNQPRIKGDNVFSPASFPPIPAEEPQSATFEMPTLRTEDLEELHSLLVLEKFVTFSQALLKSIVADQDIAHVFHVSPQEQQIIEHSYSCYVLGRSGTGKTTTMLFKMLGMENSWQQTRDMLPNRPRQLFVTQSRVLADKVEDYFMKLLESLNVDVGTSGDIAEMLERKKNREDAGLVDRDEAANWRDDLPKKFSDLKDAHFPMFITFDKLSAMLEADVEQPRNEAGDSAMWAARRGDPADLPPSDYMQQDKQSFVSFNVFREAYWPHFPQNLTKGLDPSLVFSEFMGVIKGSEQALGSPDHALSQKAYFELSHRTQATFASKRAEIYNLFQAYTKMKRGRGDYDAADRTHSILEQLRTTGVMGNKMDFLYVDEVQDNLLIDARLLRTICRNPNGLFWAGDTAQTISVGSSFRFNDLKAFLHRFEESMQIKSSQKEAPQPKSFQLLTNYRSHGGIVQCAHSVIELITKFWPYAIDILAEEKGIVDGIKPVFFSGWDQDNVRYESFLFGAAGSHIEFGAQQCILVRDDRARERLRSQVGEIGLILTLYESKGLEFNDVLLYNFFEDSTLDIAQWRVILNALERGNRSKVLAPTFDENRHAGICTELKFLYVAITRARKNLWLVDRSDKCEPMRTYWMSKELVQHCTPSTGIPHLAVASTPEEWASTAKTLFTRKRYYQAMHSYERAGKLREKEVAHAYYLREKARDKDADLHASLKEKKEAWSVAAEAFVKSAHEAIKERSEYFRIAADCYIKTEEHGKAAQAYANASMFTHAARHYRKAGMFDDAVSIIQEHLEEVDEDDAERIMNVARLYYFNRNDLKKAAGLFETVDEQLEFVTDYDLDVAHAEILVTEQRFAEAASLHLEEGRTLAAVKLFLKDQDKTSQETSLQKAKECLFNELWRYFSFDVVPDPDNLGDTTFREVLQLLVKSNLGSKDQREMQMFRFIKDREVPQLLRLGYAIFLKGDNKLAAVLSLDHVFNDLNNFKFSTMDETNVTLQTFYSYVKLMQGLVNLQDPWANKSVHKLFCVQPASDNEVRLRQGTFLHRLYEDEKRMRIEANIDMPNVNFTHLLRRALARRLRDVIEKQSERCLRLSIFDPCRDHAIQGRCGNSPCGRQHTLDEQWFNKRIRFNLQQILILQVHQLLPSAVVGSQTRARLRRVWLQRLYDSLKPAHHKFGSISNLNLQLIPEANRAFAVVKEWVRGHLYDLDPYKSSGFFAEVFKSIVLGFSFDNLAIREYVRRARCIQKHPRELPYAFRPPAGKYVVDDLLDFFEGYQKYSLDVGIIFLRHVSDKYVPMDAGVICDFMEMVCAAVIIRGHRNRVPFHNLCLPRSWILEFFREPNQLRKRGEESKMVKSIIDVAGDVLKQLYTGQDADNLSYLGTPIQHERFIIRNIFISRICRSIALLGYNSRDRDLRQRVWRAVASLKDGQHLSALYSRYVNAEGWNAIERTVMASMNDSPLDEIVHLCAETEQVTHPASNPAPRQIRFKKYEDIPQLLSRDKAPVSVLRAEASAFVPRETVVDSPDASPVLGQNEEDSFEALDGEVEPTKQADVEAVIDSIDTGHTDVPTPVADEERSAAASTLQYYYRQLLDRRRSSEKTGALSRVYAACLEASLQVSTEWKPKSHYRFVFLGALPHLLLCVEWLSSTAQANKLKIKKKMKKAKHQDLDDLMDSLTKMNKLIKEVKSIQQMLEPRSDFHQRRDLEGLKPYVTKVEELLGSLPGSEEARPDFELAWKWIVKERTVKKIEKPTLNTDDLDEEEL